MNWHALCQSLCNKKSDNTLEQLLLQCDILITEDHIFHHSIISTFIFLYIIVIVIIITIIIIITMRFSQALNSCWVYHITSQLPPATQRCNTFLRICPVSNKPNSWAHPVLLLLLLLLKFFLCSRHGVWDHSWPLKKTTHSPPLQRNTIYCHFRSSGKTCVCFSVFPEFLARHLKGS